MTKRFQSKCYSDRVEIVLLNSGVISSKQATRGEWNSVSDPLKLAVRKLLALVDEGKAEWNGDILGASNSAVAEFSNSLAVSIGLPGPAEVFADISFHGTIGDPDPFVRVAWQDTSYQQISPKRTGILLEWGSRKGRLQGPLFDLVEGIDRLNAVAKGEIGNRIERWTDVTRALGRVNPDIVTADEYTKSLTVFQAGSFALDVKSRLDQIDDFVPILMSRTKARSLEDNAPTEDIGPPGGDQEPSDAMVDEEADRLLTSEDQNAFLRRFTADGQVRHAYQFRKSTYLLIDPDLRKALEVVKRARSGTPEEKREFIKNPRAAISAAFGLESSGQVSTALFIETKQYSDRVTGLGLWDPPQLPWLSKSSAQWIPEIFPVVIGGTEIEINRDEVNDLQEAVEEAETAEEKEVPFRDEKISLDVARDVLRQVAEKEKAKPAPADPEEKPSPANDDAPREPIVVLIKTNFEEISYEVKRCPRQAFIALELPRPRMAATKFKPHQDDGFSWLVKSWIAGWPGVLLGDDMGLGKTFQALAFLAWVTENAEAASRQGHKRKQPILVVAPTALLQNWIKESTLHLAPKGLGADRADVFGSGIRKFKNNDPQTLGAEPLDWRKIADYDWVLTTYETLADNHIAFAKISFSVAVFDEIQKIKEPGTLNTWASKAMNADFVLGLSGTPIENKIEDLWSIMDRVSPGLLGDLKVFSATYKKADELRYRALADALLKPIDGAPEIILRRMKDDVLVGLPKKTVIPYEVDMPTAQAEVYDDVVKTFISGGNRGRGAMLDMVQKLRGISLFPGDAAKFDLSTKQGCHRWQQQSARLGRTFEVLRTLEKRGERALIFVEHRSMQLLVAEAISTEFGLDRPLIINGETPGSNRQKMVDEFEARKTRFDVMVLSPKAAGVGLTIISANHVIHLSRWWNPAVEDQCNDRVYRIGQTKPVEIHIPIARHPRFQKKSFDLVLNGLLATKREMSRGLLRPPVSEADLDDVVSGITA